MCLNENPIFRMSLVLFCPREMLVRWLRWHYYLGSRGEREDSRFPRILMEEIKQRGGALWDKRRRSRLRGMQKKKKSVCAAGWHSFPLDARGRQQHQPHAHLSLWHHLYKQTQHFTTPLSKYPLFVQKHPVLSFHLYKTFFFPIKSQ